MRTLSPPELTQADRRLLQERSVELRHPERKAVMQKFVIGCIALCLSLLALEGAARVIVTATDPTEYGSAEADCKFTIAQQAPPKGMKSLILLGTSFTSRGLYPELLQERLREKGIKLDVRSLAYSGCIPLGQVDLLDTAIKHHTSPTAVVLDVSPFWFNHDAKVESIRSVHFEASPRGHLLLPAPPGILARIKREAEIHSYLVRYRDHLRYLLTTIPERIFSSQKYIRIRPNSATHVESSAAGFAPAFTVSNDERMATAMTQHLDRLKQASFNRVASGGKATGQFASRHLDCNVWKPLKNYCDKRGIPIILIWMPQHSVAEAIYQKQLNLTAQQASMAFENIAQENGLYFIDLHEDKDTAHYFDFDHLNAYGAAFTTERLAAILTSPEYKDMIAGRRKQ